MFNIEIFNAELTKAVERKELSEKTREYYVAALINLNRKCEGDFQASNIEKAINELCQNNKQAQKYIAAVKKYERDILKAPQTMLYGEPLMRLRQKHKIEATGKEISLSEETYLKKINRLNNKKLKLAFRLQYRSGLRVAEIAALDKDTIKFDEQNEGITLIVKNGKGRKSRIVHVQQDSYLYRNLRELVEEQADDDGPLFYSESYLKKKAGEYGMETHDLRRINSRTRFRTARSSGEGKRAARRAVAKELGHENVKTTNAYLGSDWDG